MFSTSQMCLLNSAKEEGKMWRELAYEDVMYEIRRQIAEMNLFEIFRKELFNQRPPVAILNYTNRMKQMNHSLMDPVDAHELILENDGYEELACEMGDIKLSYKVSETIQLKFELIPREVATTLLPASDDGEESPIARQLDFEEDEPDAKRVRYD